MTRLQDGIVGAMAMDIARSGSNPVAVRLLREATSISKETFYIRGDSYPNLVLELPLDFMDQLDDAASAAIIESAKRGGIPCRRVDQRLAPEVDGWRDRLAEIEDWGPTASAGDDWSVINERVHELKSLFQRAITPDDRADVGRRCRELLIAASSATFRPTMVPDGQEQPKASDAKGKCTLIVEHVGVNSVDERLSKLIDKAWDLAVGLTHHGEPSRPATYAAAQSCILVVRTLAVIADDLGQ